MLPILVVLFGIMEFANNALKDGISTHKIFVFQLVIYAPHGLTKVPVNRATMAILLNKVYVFKIMILALYQIVTCFVKLGLEILVLNALKEHFSIVTEFVYLLAPYVIHLKRQQEIVWIVSKDMMLLKENARIHHQIEHIQLISDVDFGIGIIKNA